MTGEEVKIIIKKSLKRDYSISKIRGRWVKKDLYILLILMYYSHLKMVDALKVTPKNIQIFGGFGTYFSNRYNSKMRFEIDDKTMGILYEYMKQNNIRLDEPLIRNQKRALIYAFNQLTAENGITDCKLTDVYRAGLRDNPEVKIPYAVKKTAKES